MSSERINQGPEIKKSDAEALDQARNERLKELHEQLEKKSEQSHEKADDALKEARERAKSIEMEKEPAKAERHVSPAERRVERKTKKEKDIAFETTMAEVRSQMPGPSRVFSKVIHNKAVEAVSEAAGNTIARPNAILSGAIFAFGLTLAVYLVAKNFGYPLSGFESIGAFALGWALGIAYDFLKVMVTGRR